MKKLLVIMVVMGVIAMIGGNSSNDDYTYEDSYGDTYEASSDYESDYESESNTSDYETSEYDDYSTDYSTYNDTAPVSEELFEASDITGRWTDSPGSEIGMFLDITGSGSELTYDYYQIQRGNSNFVNLNNETTKWEYCNGDVIMQANHGSFMCMRGSDYECYVSFYYIDSNTICHQESGEYFYRVY